MRPAPNRSVGGGGSHIHGLVPPHIDGSDLQSGPCFWLPPLSQEGLIQLAVIGQSNQSFKCALLERNSTSKKKTADTVEEHLVSVAALQSILGLCRQCHLFWGFTAEGAGSCDLPTCYDCSWSFILASGFSVLATELWYIPCGEKKLTDPLRFTVEALPYFRFLQPGC